MKFKKLTTILKNLRTERRYRLHMVDVGQLRGSAEAHMRAQEWSDAVSAFTVVLDALSDADSEELLLIKCSCLLNRSLCFFLLTNLDAAWGDAQLVALIGRDHHFEVSHPDIASTAMLRFGQVSEMRGNLLPALRFYCGSAALYPPGDGSTAKSRLLDEIGVVTLPDDPELQIFSEIPAKFTDVDLLFECLSAICQILTAKKLEVSFVTKVNSAGVCRLFFSVIQLYYNTIEIRLLIRALNCLTIFASYGAGEVWMGYELLGLLATRFSSEYSVFVELVHLLQFTPSSVFDLLATKVDLLTPLCDSLSFSYSDEDLQTVFFLMFQLSHSPASLDFLVGRGLVEFCMGNRTTGSFLLISKLCYVPDGCRRLSDAGALLLAFEILENKENEPTLLRAALVVTSRIILTSGFATEVAARVFDCVMPVVLKHSKAGEIVGPAFAALALCVRQAPAKVVETRGVQVASVILSIFTREVKVAVNTVTFLFECADSGLVPDVLQVRAALPTVVKALEEHMDDEMIVERAVGLLVLCRHQRADALLQAAVQRFPQSQFLAKFLSVGGP
jgi:hypothetical protein